MVVLTCIKAICLSYLNVYYGVWNKFHSQTLKNRNINIPPVYCVFQSIYSLYSFLSIHSILVYTYSRVFHSLYEVQSMYNVNSSFQSSINTMTKHFLFPMDFSHRWIKCEKSVKKMLIAVIPLFCLSQRYLRI